MGELSYESGRAQCIVYTCLSSLHSQQAHSYSNLYLRSVNSYIVTSMKNTEKILYNIRKSPLPLTKEGFILFPPLKKGDEGGFLLWLRLKAALESYFVTSMQNAKKLFPAVFSCIVFFGVTPLKIRGAGGVMNSWIKQITGAKSNSLNPSYVRGMTQKFGNKIWLRLKAALAGIRGLQVKLITKASNT